MKTKLSLIVVAILTIATIQTTYAQSAKSKTFNVSTFSVIDANVVGNIEFEYAQRATVEATGDQEFLDNLLVKVEGGVLKLTQKKKIDRRNFFKRLTPSKNNLKIRIGAPALTEIRSKGVGNFTAKDIQADKFHIVSNGVGNVNINNIRNRELTVESTGVGNVNLKGITETLFINANSVGNVNARDLSAVNGDIISKGVGNITCKVAGNLSIKKNGVGNVQYYGNPSIKNMNVSGPGRVNSAD